MTALQRSCIYCTSTTFPKTAEHVLNKAFKTDLTLTNEVCHDCNSNYFSAFDKALVDYVRMLDPLRNHPSVGSHDLTFFNGRVSLAYEPEGGFSFALRFDTKDGTWNRVPLQQIIIRPDQKMVYLTGGASPDYEKRMALMRSELARPELLQFTRPDWRTLENSRPENPIIVRSAENIYAVISESEERDEEIVAQIRNGAIGSLFANLAGVATPGRVVAPEFIIRGHSLDPEVPIAKIGFNFACKVLGYEAVMRKEFDWARRFIRYGEQPSKQCVTLFTAEERAEKMAKNPLVARLCSVPGHKLLLYSRPGMALQVSIIIYEHLFGNVELLRDDETSWIDTTFHLAVFDYHKKTHELLSMPKDHDRLDTLIGTPGRNQRNTLVR